ncbi:MAG: class I SAM-dependent methyltransferase [Gammaproteobacteria bacterium]
MNESTRFINPIEKLIDFKSKKLNGVEQCRRLLHGRGHAYKGLEHISIDWLPPVALITIYKEEVHNNLESMAELLQSRLPDCHSVQVQYRCRHMSPTELLWGEEITELVVEESGLKYQLRLGATQNTGFFLDMVNGHAWVRNNAQGKHVLNLFAYTCAFSVAALAGGAEHVLNIDISKAALSRGRDNHRMNQQDTKRVAFDGIDIFKSFSRIKKRGPYDLLICDPPSLQKGSVDIERDYKKIIRRIPEFMNPGSLLILCLNSPDLSETFLLDTVADECPECKFKESISTPEVFREAVSGKGLKVLVFEYLIP